MYSKLLYVDEFSTEMIQEDDAKQIDEIIHLFYCIDITFMSKNSRELENKHFERYIPA